MHAVVASQLETVRSLCQMYRVTRLSLFGSATNGGFRPGESDLDFLVTFPRDFSPEDHYNAYFGLTHALETLFGTAVDLVEEPTIHNPYFREEVEETRIELYAA
jgi:predicted nucleotidyltransferase